MKKSILLVTFLYYVMLTSHAQLISATKTNFALTDAAILVDEKEDALVIKAATLLQQDIEIVTGKKVPLTYQPARTTNNLIIIGTADKSSFIQVLAAAK